MKAAAAAEYPERRCPKKEAERGSKQRAIHKEMKKQESFKFGRSQRRRKKYYSINKNCDTHSHTQRGKKTNKE